LIGGDGAKAGDSGVEVERIELRGGNLVGAILLEP